MEILKEEPLPPEVPTLVLPNTEDVLKLGDRLDGVRLIILDFPKFTDGRAYTQARLLRERLGYTGELRASGAVLIDQLPFLLRCVSTADCLGRSVLLGVGSTLGTTLTARIQSRSSWVSLLAISSSTIGKLAGGRQPRSLRASKAPSDFSVSLPIAA